MPEIPDSRPRTLQELCCARIKETFPLSALSAKLLCDLGLPAPIVRVLAECMPPSELLELENITKDKSVTEAGWEHQCEKLRCTSKLRRSSMHPAALGTFDEAMSSYRDVWLQFYFSQYLWPHFDAWDPERPETHARGFLFHARDQETVEQYPLWTFEEFEQHTVKLAEEAKCIGIRPHTQGGYRPKIIQAFQVNLTFLTVDMLREKNFQTFFWGHGLREIFQSLRDSNLAWGLPTHTRFNDLDFVSRSQVLQELVSKGCLKCLKLTGVELSLDSWDLLFFVCSGQFYCQQCAQRFSAGLRDMSVTVAETAASCSVTSVAQIPWHTADTLEKVGCLHIPLDTLHTLKKMGYPGLADWDPESPNPASAEDLANSVDVSYDESLCEGEELEGKDSDTSGSNFVDDVLCNEVSLGCGALSNSNRKVKSGSCHFSGADFVVEEISEKVSAGIDRTYGAASNSRGSNDYTSEFRGWIAEMGQAHISEDHKSRGIQALSLQANNCDRLQTDTVVLALAARLPFWTCLSTLHIRLQPIAAVRELGKHLLERIRKGGLKDLLLIREENSFGDDPSPALEEFFWEVLQELASRQMGSQNCRPPMQQLSIDGDGVKFWKPVQLPGEACFHGLQLLKLIDVWFDGPSTFSPLAQYIGRDQALRCLYLKYCCLDAESVDLLLNALDTEGSHSVEVLDLQSSVAGMSKSQWSKLCRLLTKRPLLTLLSLRKCSITNDQVGSAKFVAAVKMHGTDRKLTLDLSFNDIGDGLGDFMSSAVCPGSSLKDLRIVGTWKKEQQGIDVADRILVNYAPHLPLLQYLSVGSFHSNSLPGTKALDEVRKKMQRIAKVVSVMEQNVMVEHIAVM